jgi:hypothetical protein
MKGKITFRGCVYIFIRWLLCLGGKNRGLFSWNLGCNLVTWSISPHRRFKTLKLSSDTKWISYFLSFPKQNGYSLLIFDSVLALFNDAVLACERNRRISTLDHWSIGLETLCWGEKKTTHNTRNILDNSFVKVKINGCRCHVPHNLIRRDIITLC